MQVAFWEVLEDGLDELWWEKMLRGECNVYDAIVAGGTRVRHVCEEAMRHWGRIVWAQTWPGGKPRDWAHASY